MNALLALAFLAIPVCIAFAASRSAVLSLALVLIVPYLAFLTFAGGFIWRILLWARSPVPFRIPTTCGQQKSLPWVKDASLESPSTVWGTIVRMLLEVVLFRSLFRNIRMEMTEGRPVYGSAKWLWFFGLLFHGSLLLIVIRHLRFFIEPVPRLINALSAVDGFF